MQIVTLQLTADTEQALREKAGRIGLTLEAYLQRLADREAMGNGAPPDGMAQLPQDLERELDQLSAGLPALPILPADFSRADIYGGHD